jgi:hypothetical protein
MYPAFVESLALLPGWNALLLFLISPAILAIQICFRLSPGGVVTSPPIYQSSLLPAFKGLGRAVALSLTSSRAFARYRRPSGTHMLCAPQRLPDEAVLHHD